MKIVIENGRLIDPAQDIDQIGNIYIEGDKIIAIGERPSDFTPDQTIDASGQIVCPGFIDIQARLREPGEEHKGTIASESAAAAHGGITTLCIPPDTDPIIDTAVVAEQLHRRAARIDSARILPIGALTQELNGEQLSEMKDLSAAGCIAMSNSRHPIASTLVLRRTMEYAASHDILVILQPEDPWLAKGGVMHEGDISSRLGLPGIPECAEVIAVSRDLYLIEQTGVRAHFGQISSARAMELIIAARKRGLAVTVDVAIHQLLLTDVDADNYNSLCHVQPPLRNQRDRDGLRAALSDGLIDAICSDHQPHDPDAKLAPFTSTEPGISALETLLPLLLRLVEDKVIDLSQAIKTLTQGPAEIFGLPNIGTLIPGQAADITIFDPDKSWIADETTLLSRGKNTPFINWEMRGAVTHTLLAGSLTYSDTTS